MDGQELAEGDEIGIFWNELCVGAGVYQRGKPIVISAWKGDEKLGIPGYRAGEPLTFKAFSKRFTREYELSAEYARPEQGRFEGAAYAVVRLTGQPGLLPERYALHQNYPNPFNSRTVIPYDVPHEAAVSIIVYDLLGKEIIRLADRRFHQPGKYKLEWSGLDTQGAPVSSGIYFVRFFNTEFHAVQKLVLMK